jgi:hypothetical protein
MTDEPTNADRAQWAKDALAIFTARTFSGDHPDTMARDDLECAISDLICDLLHYARQQEFDTGSIIQQAAGHFGFELLEEALHPEGDEPLLPTPPAMPVNVTATKLLEALDYLLAQTVDMDLKYDITLSEGEEDARAKALSAIAEATGRSA